MICWLSTYEKVCKCDQVPLPEFWAGPGDDTRPKHVLHGEWLLLSFVLVTLRPYLPSTIWTSKSITSWTNSYLSILTTTCTCITNRAVILKKMLLCNFQSMGQHNLSSRSPMHPAAPVALKKVTIMFMISMTNKLTIGDDEQFIWIISCALLGSKCLQVGVNGPMVSTLSTQRGN